MIKNSIVLSLLFLYSNLTFAQKSNAIIGIWLNEEKDAQIEVYEKDKLFFGKIVWLKNAKDENGNWVLDSKNPDLSLRNRKKMGLTILHNLKWDGDKNEIKTNVRIYISSINVCNHVYRSIHDA